MPRFHIDNNNSSAEFTFQNYPMRVQLVPPLSPTVTDRHAATHTSAMSILYHIGERAGGHPQECPVGTYHVMDFLASGRIILKKDIPANFPFPLTRRGVLRVRGYNDNE